jgi:uncharacterized protein (DUF952 family)
MSARYVYRVLLRAEWNEMLAAGRFSGSALDRRDGYIHLSTREQVAGTIAAHFAGASDDLVVIEIDAALLGSELRWETSRGGARFPHLYGVLPVSTVARTMRADELDS